MKNSAYYCRLSGGNVYRVEFATSAGEAIHQAIWLHRGNTVTECWQGPEMQKQSPGRINYEVPKHEPIPHEAAKPVNRRPKDHSDLMPFMQETSK
jgi:hypothetical protein